MVTESDIKAQRGAFWVQDNRDGTYSVLIDGTTCAIAFEAYNDVSLAVARMDYLARTVQDTTSYYDRLRSAI